MRTIKKHASGKSVRGASAVRIETAARALGIELPAPKKRGRG